MAREDGRFGWMEACILPAEVADDPKRVKLLELELQHGQGERLDYDSLDWLVGVYNDVVRNCLLMVEEYARGINAPIREVQSMIAEARTMMELLAFAQAPHAYHLIRELDLLVPIRESVPLLDGCVSEADGRAVRDVVFANLLVLPSSEGLRTVRRIKTIARSSVGKEFLQKEKLLVEGVMSCLGDMGAARDGRKIEGLRSNEELVQSAYQTLNSYDAKAKGIKAMASPFEGLRRATQAVEGIDDAVLACLEPGDATCLRACVRKLSERLDSILESVPESD